MTATSPISIRRARRDDVDVRMLADDPLGSGPRTDRGAAAVMLFGTFEAVDRDPRILVVVAEDNDGAVVGCL